MSFSVDKWIASARPFHLSQYNCWHFLRDAWLDATGFDLGDRVPANASGYRERFERGASQEHKRISEPVSPCIAYFPKARKATPHIGMYWRGKILHLDRIGALYEKPSAMTARMGPVEYYL